MIVTRVAAWLNSLVTVVRRPSLSTLNWIPASADLDAVSETCSHGYQGYSVIVTSKCVRMVCVIPTTTRLAHNSYQLFLRVQSLHAGHAAVGWGQRKVTPEAFGCVTLFLRGSRCD